MRELRIRLRRPSTPPASIPAADAVDPQRGRGRCGRGGGRRRDRGGTGRGSGRSGGSGMPRPRRRGHGGRRRRGRERGPSERTVLRDRAARAPAGDEPRSGLPSASGVRLRCAQPATRAHGRTTRARRSRYRYTASVALGDRRSGSGTWDRPPVSATPLRLAGMAAAKPRPSSTPPLELFTASRTPFYCFHDLDPASPPATPAKQSWPILEATADKAAGLRCGSDRRPPPVGHGRPFGDPRRAAGAQARTPTRRCRHAAGAGAGRALRSPTASAARTTSCRAGWAGYDTSSTPDSSGGRASSVAQLRCWWPSHRTAIGLIRHPALIEPKPHEPTSQAPVTTTRRRHIHGFPSDRHAASLASAPARHRVANHATRCRAIPSTTRSQPRRSTTGHPRQHRRQPG